MISYLNGKVIAKKDKFIVLSVNNVGYKVFLSKKALSGGLNIGDNLQVFTFLNFKETGIELYGFKTEEELELFEVIENIRGIGPKAALEISSIGPLERIKERILANDDKLFEGISGIGKKKAMAIFVELSGKLREVPTKTAEESDESEEALVRLGFPRAKAKEALKNISSEKSSEEKIKEALKILGR